MIIRVLLRKCKDLVIRNLALMMCLLPAITCGHTINPLNYGLLEAKSSVERYNVLAACHKEAYITGAAVSYQGINLIEIEIPKGAIPMPLTITTDFCGVTLKIFNENQDVFLFEMINDRCKVDISGRDLHKNARLYKQEFITGCHMLMVQDDSLWVYRRRNKNYGAKRRDMLLVKNGVVQNEPVCSYDTPSSKPSVFLCNADFSGVRFGNITMIRDSCSTKKTYLVHFANVYNLVLSNINIITPNPQKLYADRVICCENVFKMCLNNIRIEGTYSQIDKYGYGLDFNNIFDLRVNQMYARSNWGIFGMNNVNCTTLKDCDINRFDIHCYGKDVKAKGCIFNDLYNQFSSVYGCVEFKDCVFNNFIPVLIESSYNAYTPFNITFTKCLFNMNSKRNYLINLLGLEEEHNSRPELSRKSLPNIFIQDCTVNFIENQRELVSNKGVPMWYVVKTGNVRYKETLDNISYITIDGLSVSQSCEFDIFSNELCTTKPIYVIIKNMYTNCEDKCEKYIMPYATVDRKASVICNGKVVCRKTLVDRIFPYYTIWEKTMLN